MAKCKMKELSSVPEIKLKIDKAEIPKDIALKLMKVKVSSSIDSIDIAKITFHEQEAELQENSLFDIGKAVVISVGYKQKFKEIFNGEITRVDYNYIAGEVCTLQLVCFNKLFHLSRIRHSRAFLKMKDSAIAEKMAGEAGMQKDVEATSETHEYIFQNNQSNLDFLRMRAKRIGYEVAMNGEKFVFKKRRFADQDKSVELKWGENLSEFCVKMDSSNILEEVIVTSWDPVTKKEVEGKAKAGDEDPVASPSKIGTKEVKSKLKHKAKSYKIDIPNLKAKDAKEIAKAELLKRSMDFLTANGICRGSPDIQCAKIITINGVGKRISGDYYIVSCEHIYSKDGYKVMFEAKNNGSAK